MLGKTMANDAKTITTNPASKDEADDNQPRDGGQPTFDASLDHDGSKNIPLSFASCHNITLQQLPQGTKAYRPKGI